MKRRGFTLIELLVVVSIIALLIAILLPSLKKAREQSKAVVCASNLRSIELAVHLYANNHNDRLITAGLAHGGSVNEHAAWTNTLREEYANPEILRCPADQSEHWKVPIPGTTALRRTSYASNYYTVAEIAGRGPWDKLSKFERPSGTIHLVDLTGEGEFAASDHVHPESWILNPAVMAAEEVAYERHLGRGMYGFMDGHAEPLTFEQSYSYDVAASAFPKIAWIHNRYNPDVAR